MYQNYVITTRKSVDGKFRHDVYWLRDENKRFSEEHQYYKY